jgi:hypothetical protein
MPARIIQPHELPPSPSPIIISESPTHIVVAVEIAKAELAQHRRFLEMLVPGGEGRTE